MLVDLLISYFFVAAFFFFLWLDVLRLNQAVEPAELPPLVSGKLEWNWVGNTHAAFTDDQPSGTAGLMMRTDTKAGARILKNAFNGFRFGGARAAITPASRGPRGCP